MPFTSVLHFRTQSSSIVTRLLLHDPTSFYQWLRSSNPHYINFSLGMNVNFNDFFSSWMVNQNFLNNPRARRLNALSLLLSFQEMPTLLFQKHLEPILKEFFAEIHQQQDQKDPTRQANSKRDQARVKHYERAFE
jgi:hypothetical protein